MAAGELVDFDICLRKLLFFRQDLPSLQYIILQFGFSCIKSVKSDNFPKILHGENGGQDEQGGVGLGRSSCHVHHF